MTLTAETKLGPYKIVALLGAGGMGEVYRARDTKLNREVALKVLPEAFAKDAARMARFQREAQVLASLNHPNIAAIYGLEESDGVRALVMELVEGPTLAERITRGPIPLNEALPIGRELAEALEYAHDKGIVHRDLKPANVKATSDGKVKVLDFGLAKALESPASSNSSTSRRGRPEGPGEGPNSPTLTVVTSQAGVILGTAAYMSPEQARGKPVDKRADIWAFGCVLYEALTARRAFPGDNLTDILAAVIEREPDWTSLPQNTPDTMHVLLRRCLQKDPKRRLHDVADARIEIEESVRQPLKAAPPGSVAAITGRRWPLPARLLAAALLGALVTWSAIRIKGRTDGNPLHLTSVARLTHDPEFSESPTWSPDGKMLAFSSNRSGNYEIYVRQLEGGQEVNVTNDPGHDFQPDFSPDGNRIAFVSTRSSRTGLVKIGGTGFIAELRSIGGDVWVMPALGGQPRLLARDGNFPTWHPSGTKVIYVSGREDHRGLMEVTADGGTPRSVLPSESSNWEIVRVHYSPSGDWITFGTNTQQVFLLPASVGSPRELLNGVSDVWDPSGQRIYYCTRELSGGTRLRSVEINAGTGELKGEPKTVGLLTGILNDLAISCDGRQLAAAEMEGSLNLTRLPLNANGDAPSGPEEVLSRGQVFDRRPSISPDGRRIAYMSNRLGPAELWILHLGTKHPIRLDLPGHDVGVVATNWLPDSQRLSVVRGSSGGMSLLWIVAGDGSHAEQLPVPPFIAAPGEGFPVSPDGRTVAYLARSGSNFQLFGFDLLTRQSHQLTSTLGDKYGGSWSSDGRWLVYSSNATGSTQVWKVGANGGQPEQMTRGDDRNRHVFLSPDSRWLYYQPNHQNIYRMPAQGGAAQQVTHFPEAGLFIEEPTISPDGRNLVYCRSNGGSSLWVLTVGTGKSEQE